MLALVLNPFTDPFPGATENIAALLSVLAVWAVGSQSTLYMSPASGALVRWSLWLDLGRWFSAGDFIAHYGLTVDRLTATMLMVITGVGFLIHVYSTEYMEHDDGYWRYFAYLNLFVGWEGVGLCSYLLIGFWYQDTEKAWAGRKAFITNRIGDFAFIIGMILLVLMLQATEAMGRAGPGRGNFLDVSSSRAWVTAMHEQGPLNLEVLKGWSSRIPVESGEKNRGMMTLETAITEGPLKG